MTEQLKSSALVMYNTNEVKNIFKCGKKQVYELFHTKGFPALQIGRKFYVEQSALKKWIEQNTGRVVIK